MEKPCEQFYVVSSEGKDLPGRAKAKRVGVLSLISADCDTVPAMAEKARRFHEEAFTALEALEFRVLRPSLPTRTTEEAVAHIRALEDEGAEALVLYIADWSYGTTAAWAGLLSNRLPMILWTNARPDCAGLIGAGVTKGALAEVGLDAPLIYGNFDDGRIARRLNSVCVGYAAARRLRGSRYGLGGSRSLQMMTASIDPNQWLMQFGVDADGFDELDVVDRSRSIPEEEVRRVHSWMAETFGAIEVESVIVETSIRLYLALKEVIAERGFDFISVKCLPVMAKVATSFCLSHSLLGDASDADGPKERIVCACESDSNGALTMEMMKHVVDQAIGFADTRWLDPDKGVLRISNCGSQPTELASSRKEIRWVRHGLQEMPWKHGGMCPQCVSKAGRVTLARLSRIQGNHVMLITGGEALDKPREALKETYWEFSPHTWIDLDASVEAFTAELRSNHIHMMYGDFRRELTYLCEALDIRPIVPEDLQ